MCFNTYCLKLSVCHSFSVWVSLDWNRSIGMADPHLTEVHCCVHKNLLLVPILNLMNPVHTFCCYPFKIIVILSSHLYLYVFSDVFQVFLCQNFYHLLVFLCMLHTLLILSFLILFWKCLARSPNSEARLFALFSGLMVQTFCSTPCSQTSTHYVILLMWYPGFIPI
jgi:hypothetical protein